MATEADLIQKFKDLDIPVGADFEELIHAAFAGANLADLVNNYDSRITTVENDLTTKADDSKVVHDNHDGTEQLNGTKLQPFNKLSDTIGGRNLYLNSKALEDNYARNSNAVNITVEPFDSTTNMWHFVAEQGVGNNIGIYFYDYAIDKIPDNSDWSYSVDIKGTGKVVRLAIENGSMNPIVGTVGSEWSRISQTGRVGNPEHKTIVMYFDNANSPLDVYIKLPKLEQGSIATDWTPAPEDKADDSKVAHLSGANNFDTVPTVNNNPLLLASSLPADLARTTKDANFTGKLQKSGIDVATKSDVTTAVNTATENMANMADLNNYYHANASDDAALAAAKASTVSGIYWYEED